QKKPLTAHTRTHVIEKSLRLPIDPVQVFKHKNERLIEALAQPQLLQRLQRPPPPNLGVHLLQVGSQVVDAQERKEIGQRVLQAAVQGQHLARDFLPPLALLVFNRNVKVGLEQLDDRQIGGRFAVRDGVGFQYQAAALREQFEFIEQTGFP